MSEKFERKNGGLPFGFKFTCRDFMLIKKFVFLLIEKVKI